MKSLRYNEFEFAGDTLTSIASGLAGVINGDSTLSALGITATSASTVVNIKSTSNNLTTYTKSTSAGATETIVLGQSTGITNYAFNNLNELTSTAGGGAARFQGTTNKPIKSATINSSVHASLPTSTSFNANASLSTGINASTVNVVDGNNASLTNTYQVGVQGGPSASLAYDLNGNMTSDGTNSFAWDAEDRLIKITYPGTSNFSTFVYDGFGHNVSIVETISGSVTSTKQFVWCGQGRCESHDASGSIAAQYFPLGEILGGTAYFCLYDQSDSTCEMTNGSGSPVSVRHYDPFGRVIVYSETVSPDFGFAGHYLHARSGLNLSVGRAYNPTLGRWINRDPAEEAAGANVFAYVLNNPINFIDLTGLSATGLGAAGGGGPPPPNPDKDKDPQDPQDPGPGVGGGGTGSPPGKPCGEEDPCKELLRTVNNLARELVKRYVETYEDDNNLFNNAHWAPNPTVTGTNTSYVGHIIKFIEVRDDLKDAVKAAQDKNCKIPWWVKQLLKIDIAKAAIPKQQR